ncbi:MAG: M48 family metallopeptidase [Clostridia bacterium]|nr:M48 family metallopeptidase [Clostridia bacterium]
MNHEEKKEYQVTVIRSSRRTAAIEVTRDLRVIARVPRRFPETELKRFLEKHRAWIETALERQKTRGQQNAGIEEREDELRQKALEILPGKLAFYEKKMGLKANSMKITGAKTRFGSCSSKGGICFSWRLMAYPDEAVDYVVVHELAHLRVLNHSAAFYREIEKILPDYRERIALLKGKA